jgi:hypothetical protein
MKPIHLGLFLALLAATQPYALAALPSATIDFDHDAEGNLLTVAPLFLDEPPLRDLYAPLGLLVRGPSRGAGPAILHQAGNFGVPARSGTNFLAFNTGADLENGGLARGPVSFLFPGLISAFEIYVSGGNMPTPFHLEAFDNTGQLIGVRDVVGPGAAYDVLSFASATPIAMVRVNAVDEVFVMDDLTFTPVPEPGTFALATVMAAFLTPRCRKRRNI